jgi:serine/threonine protein kinase
MSPEQLSGGKVDERADVWSFAIVVFECLTGRLPFRDTSRKALVPAIGGKAIEPPSSFADVPPGFDAWFAQATERERSKRVASVRALADQLRELTQGLTGRCDIHRPGEAKPLPSYKAYPSTNDPHSRNHPLSRAQESSVAAAINGRRDLDHIALIARLSRSTGVLWTRHRGEPGQWIRLTLHFEDDEEGHTTLAKVLRVNHGPSSRPSLWAYEVTVRFAQPIERAATHRVRRASSE